MNIKLRKIVVIPVVILIFLIVLGTALYNMRTDKIIVDGNERYSDEEVIEMICGGTLGKNIPVLWMKNKLGITKEIPFVEKYDIEIESYNEIRITVYEKGIVGYIDYMGTYMYFDKDGVVVESSDEQIKGIPKVTGVDFDYILLNEPLPVENKDVFDLLLTVTQTLQKYNLSVKKIYISDNMEITLYKKKVKIFLGRKKALSEKISVLKDLAPKLEGYSGTLDMSTLDTDGKYTLKKDIPETGK